MYANIEDQSQFNYFLQWDIVPNFSFPHIIDSLDWTFEVKHKNEYVILLNQSCDLVLDRNANDAFVFAPLILLSDLKKTLININVSESQMNNKVDSMKKNKSFSYIYLPYNEVIWDESFVVLSKITSLNIEYLKKYRSNVRLTDSWRHFLADRIHNYFCRAVDPTRD